MSRLPPAGPQRRFVAVSLVDALGTGLFAPLSILFFTPAAGAGRAPGARSLLAGP